MVKEGSLPQRIEVLKHDLAAIGVTRRVIQSLVAVGWTLPMIREARDLALEHGANFRHVVKLRKKEIPFPVIDELFAARSEHPGLPVIALWRCWQLCMQDRITADDREFFSQFLGAVEDLFQEARARLQSSVAKRDSFIFGAVSIIAKLSGVVMNMCPGFFSCFCLS